MKLAAVKPTALMLSKELLQSLLLLLGVSVVVFVILYLAPGNPFGALLEGQAAAAAATLPGVAEALGEPSATPAWYELYLAWLAKMLRGDFGASLRTGLPVLAEIGRIGLNTLILTLGSLIITLLVAVPIALHAASRGDTPGNRAFTLLAYVVSALPVFWLGYIVIYVFIHQFSMFPLISGAATKQEHAWLYFMVPIVVLGVGNGSLSEVIRSLREEMSRVLAEDYIRTARAKGASVWRHAFKEGLVIPVSEIIAAKIPYILSGAVIVEQVFNWPGLGRMAWQAAQDRDFPVIMGLALVAAVFVRLGSLLQRIVFTAVNPRASKE